MKNPPLLMVYRILVLSCDECEVDGFLLKVGSTGQETQSIKLTKEAESPGSHPDSLNQAQYAIIIYI